MRKPLPPRRCLKSEFWERSLAGEKPQIFGTPEAGYYKRRLVKGGPFVPCRVWIEQQIGECGELVSEPAYRCEVNGREVEAFEAWTWFCITPISEAEFRYMSDLAAWTKQHSPGEAAANPGREIDYLNHPVPEFSPRRRRRKK